MEDLSVKGPEILYRSRVPKEEERGGLCGFAWANIEQTTLPLMMMEEKSIQRRAKKILGPKFCTKSRIVDVAGLNL